MTHPRRLSVVARAAAADLDELVRLAAPPGVELEILAIPVEEAASNRAPSGGSIVMMPALGPLPGPAVARAIALARGSWLLLLEPGDRLAPDALARALAVVADAPAVLAGVEPTAALAALAAEPRALAGSVVRREIVQRARWAGTGWSGAWEIDFWLRLLPLLSDAATTEPTLRVRAGASEDAASVRERAVAVARALDETPPRAWPLVDASGARLDEAAVCRELARLASARNERESLGVAAMLWLRARSHSAARSARQAPAPRDPTREASGERAQAATVAPDSPPATAAGACSSIVLEVRSLDRGGLESVVVELALALGGEGISTAVVCTERGGSEVERLRSAGVEVVVLGAADRGAELAAWLDGRDVDLWNAHYSDLGVPLAALRGIPVVVTIHNEYAWVPNRPDDAFRRIDAVVDAYVAVSESAAAFAAARFAITRERIRVIRNALSRQAALASAASPPAPSRSAARARLGIPEEAELLVQIGRVDPVKSTMVLVDAVAALAPSRRRLVAWVVGPLVDREYAARLRRRIEDGGLGDRVRITGRRDDVPLVLAAADVFVLPSLVEGLSLAVIEALAAGVPAVLSRTGDAGFLLGEADRDRAGPLPGALVARPAIDPAVITPESFHDVVWRDDPERSAAFAAAIADVLGDLPARREAARRRAAALEPLFARGRMVREYADLFRRTVAARAERSAAFLDASLSAALRDREEAETATAALRDAVTGLLRADRALAAERGRAAAADAAVDDLASVLVRITAMLAPASVRLEQALEKLHLAKRVRAAARAAIGRGSGGT